MSQREWLVGLVIALVAAAAQAQDLEPRVYAASPIGANVVLAAAGTSRGDVLVDPTAPIENARARVGSAVFGYYRSFDFLGRSANIGATLPIVRGNATALLAGEPQRASRLGQGDARLRMTVNVAGAPAMDTATYARYRQRTTLGASVIVGVPVGQYDPARLVNLGSNRWTFKPELGVSHALGERWILDAYAGVWLFTKNGDFLGGVRKQDPLVTTQFHLSYNLSSRAWAAVDATFYAGGRSNVNGVSDLDRQNNTRVGATLSLPIARRQSLRFGYSTGVWVRLGGDFDTAIVSWQYVWGPGF